MTQCAFDNDTIVARLFDLPATFLGSPATTPTDALRAVYGPHLGLSVHSYAKHVDAYVLTCLGDHRAFLLAADQWTTEGDVFQAAHQRREMLTTALFTTFDQAMSLLSLASHYVEDGYLTRLASGTKTNADAFVTHLVVRWFQERAAAGDPWTVESAITLAALNQAANITPYIRELGRSANLPAAA